MGRIAARHSSQTGSREILIRGVPQRRQSEGKKVANRLSAIPPTEEIREASNALCCFTASVARVGCPLLLKTSLPHPSGATGAPPRRMPFSITGSHARRNHRRRFRRPHGAQRNATRAVLELRRNSADSTGGSSPHSVLAATPSAAEPASPENFADGTGIRRCSRNLRNGTSSTAWLVILRCTARGQGCS